MGWHALGSLRAHHTRQKADRLRLGEHWHELDLVFPSTVGTHINPSNLRTQWVRLVRKAELPYITIHDLRHTAATVLLAAGVPIKVVSEMLGHADVAITMRLYQHVIPSMQESAAAVMQRELSGADILDEASKLDRGK